MIDSFAKKGIVCSVLRPDENDTTIIDTLRRLAISADVVIIDWNLHGDDGQKAQEMIAQVVSSSDTPPSQLRLIVIYTGESHIAGIADKIHQNLQQKFNQTVQREGDLTLILGANRIAVLAKEESKVLPAYQDQLVAFEKLADRVTDEFTLMTYGLVSNVVLKSLAQIRQKTHKILSQFSSGLDAPYLTHRALLQQPDDAQELLLSLLSEELHGILEESQVGDEANLEAIRDWLANKAQVLDNFTLDVGKNQPLPITMDNLDALIKDGISSWQIDGLSKSKKSNPHKLSLTAMLNMDGAKDESLDERFAYLTTMRSTYNPDSPVLTLGTILKQDSSYWVCIQPRCDCVRLPKEERSFPFLPLSLQGENKKFDVIIKEDKEDKSYHRLLCGKKAYELKLITFAPHPEQVVKAAKKLGGFYFKDADKQTYQWLGELRTEHSLRLSNQFAADLSRVGLDESEWLRLWATKR